MKIKKLKMVGLSTMLIVCIFLLVGCEVFIEAQHSSGMQQQNQDEIASPPPENFAYHDLRVVLPVHMEVRQELVDIVQDFLDNNRVQLVDDTVDFIFLGGGYNHEYRETEIIGVFVNTTSKVITTFKGDLVLNFSDHSYFEDESVINLGVFPDDLSNGLVPNDALLITLHIPTDNLTDDVSIEIDEVETTFTNVTYTTK